eukprot:TRINITY_DN3758_c0_g4_i1.p1 TRINITY_DN3758_c0_g4~~TRINITY_DN3758_c0_g4_i1.p1  ORF type:complete len:160 (-),score=34.96 TRINITY_DN3758_c0_g4_i1:274-699(-)
MGAHCCCCCAARDGMDGEPLKTPLRPTTPNKAKPLAAMQSLEANGAAREALQAVEANIAAVEAPTAIEMEALEANGVKEEADAAALSESPTSTRYADSPNESFEVDCSALRRARCAGGISRSTGAGRPAEVVREAVPVGWR